LSGNCTITIVYVIIVLYIEYTSPDIHILLLVHLLQVWNIWLLFGALKWCIPHTVCYLMSM